MIAREEIRRNLCLPQASWSAPHWANNLLDAYKAEVLREAAQRIRASATHTPATTAFPDSHNQGIEDAADLIDPDVST